MAEARFDAELRAAGRGGHFIEIPPEVVEALGGAGRIPVAATFDGVPYRGSIVRYRGTTMIGVPKAIIAQAGASVGDMLGVVARNDDTPRRVEVPPELASLLRKDRVAKRAFEALSYSHQREHVNHITEAKKPETRIRRAERAVAMLRDQSP